MPSSQLSYAEATLSMDLHAWIAAHNHAYAYFGDVTQIVVLDNFKASVTKHTVRELVVILLTNSWLNITILSLCLHTFVLLKINPKFLLSRITVAIDNNCRVFYYSSGYDEKGFPP